jgi:nitrogen regulatory protein PII
MTQGELKRIKDANGSLAEVISRNMNQALERVMEMAEGKSWDDQNLEAMVAFEAMRSAQEERHNLRSMQAWLAVKVGREQLYLAFPPTQEHPEGFGSLKEWLRAVGITGSTVYALDGLGMEVAPLLEEHGIEVEGYLNADRFPKLAEAIPRLRDIARGEETEHTVQEIMEDVGKAQSRDDMRHKYRKQTYIAQGAVNNLGNKRVMTIVSADKDFETLLNTLQGKVDWHAMSCTAEERQHEVILRLLREEPHGDH